MGHHKQINLSQASTSPVLAVIRMRPNLFFSVLYFRAELSDPFIGVAVYVENNYIVYKVRYVRFNGNMDLLILLLKAELSYSAFYNHTQRLPMSILMA